MSDITEQRFVMGEYSPVTDSQLHKVPVLDDAEELIEMNEEFSLEEFQVVRREFFAHTREPAVTFNNRKFYVNSACLTKFPNTEYVQALINPHTKILALRPCNALDIFTDKPFDDFIKALGLQVEMHFHIICGIADFVLRTVNRFVGCFH